MKQRVLMGLAPLALALPPAPASAHHSFSMFDLTRTETVTGAVKSLELVNPHSWLTVAAVDAQGRPADWAFEMGAPIQMSRAGWTASSVQIGEQVTVQLHPMRDGSHGGQLVSLTLADGQILRTIP